MTSQNTDSDLIQRATDSFDWSKAFENMDIDRQGEIFK